MYEDDIAVYDSRRPPEPPEHHLRPTTERPRVKWLLIAIAVVFMLLVINLLQAWSEGRRAHG